MPDWRKALSSLKCHRWLVWLGWFAAAIVVLMVLVAFAGPPLLRGPVERALAKELQRSVQIGRVAFNPLSLSATVENLRIGGLQGRPDMLDVGRIHVDLQASSLFRGGVVIAALKIDRPQVYVARIAENRYDFSDIVEHFAKKPKDPDESPTRFALYNFELTRGELRFDDLPTKSSHTITALDIGVPFVSSVPADVTIEVQPRLSAVVDGAKLSADGQTRPFLEAPEATLDFKLEPLALEPLMAYLPVTTRLKLGDGKLAATLELKFRQPKGRPPEIGLSGHVDALGWKLVRRRDDGELARFEQLGIDLAELRLDTRKVRLSNVEWKGVATTLQWDKARRIGLVREIEEELAGYQPEEAKGAKPTSELPKPDATARHPWAWQIDRFALLGGRLTLVDESVSPAFKAELTPIDLEVKGLSEDFAKPAEVKFSAKGDGGEQVSAEGRLAPDPLLWEGAVDFSGIRPARSSPYIVATLPTLLIDSGVIEGRVPMHLVGGKEGVAVKLSDAQLKIADVALRMKAVKQPFFKADRFEVAGVNLEPHVRTVSIGNLRLADAQFSAERGKDGEFDLAALLPPPAEGRGKDAAPAASPQKEAPWAYTIGEASVEKSTVNYGDLSGKVPLKLVLSPLEAKLSNLSSNTSKPAAFSVKTGWNKTGRFDANGQFSLEPLRAAVKVDAKLLDLVAPLALFTQDYEVQVTRAQASARGELELDQSKSGVVVANWKGDASVTNLNSVDLINDTNFVRWKNFAFSRMVAKSEPLSLEVGSVALDDFQTRLILDAQGNLNLREITRGHHEAGHEQGATDIESEIGKTKAMLPPPESARPLPPVKIGKIMLSGGDIRYSDRFVRPNLDANLRDVAGTISGVGTDPSSLAEIALRGTVDGSAPLEVNGQLAPFRQDRYLDIKAAVRGYELTGLSAYSGKYVGYGIEKGKLSLDLRYQIKERQLTAENRLFLDQLTFGDKVDSPDATTLPVQLAVSLLKNGRGEIEVNLPVAGTLDDPEFSFGGLIWTMVGNFFKKVVTAPFSFLGGGDSHGDLAFVDFQDGSAKLDDVSQKKIETVAKALLDKPELKLEVTGRVGVDELAALKRETVRRKLRMLKSRQIAQSGGSIASLDDVKIPPEEYANLLERVYKDEKFDKPKNFIGLAKSLPPEEMEKLLIEHSGVTEADLPRLAQARGNTVKSWFVEKGQVPAERIFVLAPKVGPEEGSQDAKSHGVSFALR